MQVIALAAAAMQAHELEPEPRCNGHCHIQVDGASAASGPRPSRQYVTSARRLMPRQSRARAAALCNFNVKPNPAAVAARI
jgi:hypothetical protein